MHRTLPMASLALAAALAWPGLVRAVDVTVVAVDPAGGAIEVRKPGETRTSVVGLDDATLITRQGQAGAVGIESLQPGDIVRVEDGGTGTVQRIVVVPQTRVPAARAPSRGAMAAPSGGWMAPPSGSALSPGSGQALQQGGRRKPAGSQDSR